MSVNEIIYWNLVEKIQKLEAENKERLAEIEALRASVRFMIPATGSPAGYPKAPVSGKALEVEKNKAQELRHCIIYP